MSISVQLQREAAQLTNTSNVVKNNPTKQIFTTKPMQLSSARQEAANNLKARILQLLDLKDNFLQVSFVKKADGTMFLKLTRPQDDNDREDQRNDFRMGSLKSKLGIKDKVLAQHNNLGEITGRPSGTAAEVSDSSTIEKGQSLMIPLTELGQDFWCINPKSDIKDYVQKYLETE